MLFRNEGHTLMTLVLIHVFVSMENEARQGSWVCLKHILMSVNTRVHILAAGNLSDCGEEILKGSELCIWGFFGN